MLLLRAPSGAWLPVAIRRCAACGTAGPASAFAVRGGALRCVTVRYNLHRCGPWRAAAAVDMGRSC